MYRKDCSALPLPRPVNNVSRCAFFSRWKADNFAFFVREYVQEDSSTVNQWQHVNVSTYTIIKLYSKKNQRCESYRNRFDNCKLPFWWAWSLGKAQCLAFSLSIHKWFLSSEFLEHLRTYLPFCFSIKFLTCVSSRCFMQYRQRNY